MKIYDVQGKELKTKKFISEKLLTLFGEFSPYPFEPNPDNHLVYIGEHIDHGDMVIEYKDWPNKDDYFINFGDLVNVVTPQIGKWYENSVDGSLVFVEKVESDTSIRGYGFNRLGDWTSDTLWGLHNKVVLASEEKIKHALTMEARKRGLLTIGTAVMTVGGCVEECVVTKDYPTFLGTSSWNLAGKEWGDGCMIFCNGNWAKPIEYEYKALYYSGGDWYLSRDYFKDVTEAAICIEEDVNKIVLETKRRV